jgi:predicted aconitase
VADSRAMTGPAPSLDLSDHDRALLSGVEGEAPRLAMEILVGLARAQGARRFIDITRAHIDGCLYHGQVSLDFAERLVDMRARVRVPASLNVGAVDLLHPDLFRGDPALATAARRLMEAYVAMGCRPTFTCAPYQLESRPSLGEHVAWAESNAIAFANSVLGARTDRYGDFTDICAAITGRVPEAGLHLDENRRGGIVFDVAGIPDRLLREAVLYPVLGHLVGAMAGNLVPVIEGLAAETVTEERLKALGAAAASSGSVALFHVVGVTPEAPTLEATSHGRHDLARVPVTGPMLRAARDELSTSAGPSLDAVSLGTPHFSAAEFAELVELLDGDGVHSDLDLFVSTGRDVLAEVESRGWRDLLERAGATLVTDTCTYITPILDRGSRTVMTNSAKWAYYAPGNVGVEVVFGSLAECVRSAVAGRLVRDEGLWADG